MRALVTGGAGFIGSHLVDRLLGEGHEVWVLDNFDPFYGRDAKERNLSSARGYGGFRLVEGDLADGELVYRTVSEACPEGIFHLAARAGVRPSIERPAAYAESNVLGTVNLFEAARRWGGRPRIVYASSSSVYGDRPSGDGAFRESDRVDEPVSPYAASKKACELFAHTYHHLHGLELTGLRFFTAYGPRNRPDLAVAKFARLIEAGLPVPMYGDGSTERDYTYVGDVVEGVCLAMERGGGGCRIYNLGNSRPVALREMIAALGRALGREPLVERFPEQPGDVRRTFADIEAARRDLGYEPKTPFEEGIRRYVAWLRGEGA